MGYYGLLNSAINRKRGNVGLIQWYGYFLQIFSSSNSRTVGWNGLGILVDFLNVQQYVRNVRDIWQQIRLVECIL